jgi:hypothetical protein
MIKKKWLKKYYGIPGDHDLESETTVNSSKSLSSLFLTSKYFFITRKKIANAFVLQDEHRFYDSCLVASSFPFRGFGTAKSVILSTHLPIYVAVV